MDISRIPKNSVLGINFSGMHDSAISIVNEQGIPIFAQSLERTTRFKGDGRFPSVLLEKINWKHISKVAISVSKRYKETAISTSSYLDTKLAIDLNINRAHHPKFYEELKKCPAKIEFIPHHISHAASSFWLSGLEDAICLVYDGGMSNEEWFGGVFTASHAQGITADEYFPSQKFVNITWLYSVTTAALGFTPLKHEGKLTGLAAYAKPNTKCMNILTKWLETPDPGILRWENTYSAETTPVLRKHSTICKQLRADLESFSNETIAASLQRLSEKHVESIVKKIKIKFGDQKNICLSGGLFANVKINKMISESGFKNTFVVPSMTDDGASLGAALFVASKGSKFKPEKISSMYLGERFSKSDVSKALKKENIKFSKSNASAEDVANLLASGSIVGIFNGAMEFGPRALGNRTILASADHYDQNDKINKSLERTEFMPFAPICRDVDATELFKNLDPVQHSAEFMTMAVECTEKMRKLCPATVHIDNTARPQVISKKQNVFIFDVLSFFSKKTGMPALINTSFNVHEEPIVCSPQDAIRGFFEAGLDALFIQGYLINLTDNLECQVKFLRNKIKIRTNSSKNLQMAYNELEDSIKDNAILTKTHVELLEKEIKQKEMRIASLEGRFNPNFYAQSLHSYIKKIFSRNI